MKNSRKAGSFDAGDPALGLKPAERPPHIVDFHLAFQAEAMQRGKCRISRPCIMPKPEIDEQIVLLVCALLKKLNRHLGELRPCQC
jgi:hypothetical protein